MRRYLLLGLAALVLLGAGAGVFIATRSPGILREPRPVVLLGDQQLASGAEGIPPRPTLAVRLAPARHAADYQAALDGQALPLQDRGAGAGALTLPAQPQGSSHHLEVWRPGSGGSHDDATTVDFRIVEPLRLAVGWLSGAGGTRARVTWSRQPADLAPLRQALAAAGATLSEDPSEVAGTWPAARAGQRLQFSVAAGLPAADGGYLAQVWSPGITVGDAAAAVQLSDPVAPGAEGLRLQVYYIGGVVARQDLARHARQISVLTPAFYSVDGAGAVHSNIDTAALSLAQQGGAEVQPLVTNQDFDAATGHALLADPSMAGRVGEQLLAQAQAHGYTGYQLDFENIPVADRDLLTGFSRSLADRLRAAGLGYSVAVVPRRATSSPNGQAALYDYPSLTQGAGWLTMMAYDQHTRQEDPGPVAGLDWVREVIGFSATGLDPSHIYLGMPLYSRDFSLQAAPAARSYQETIDLAAAGGGTLDWGFDIATAHAQWLDGGVQHVAWLDGRDSLAAKMALAREQHLVGVSAWRLGLEDPDFWSLWPSR